MNIQKHHAIISVLLFLFIASSSSQETIQKQLSSFASRTRGLLPECIFGVQSISYILYTRSNERGVRVLKNDSSMPLRSGRTIFVIHGFVSHANNSQMYELINAFLKKEDVNIFSVDWDKASCSDGFTLSDYLAYPSGINNAIAVGRDVARFSLNLALNHGVAINKTTLMGHSLGGHVAGFAGKHIQNLSGQNYSMIVGLDVAGSGYFFKGCHDRLCHTDARYVMAIHTSELLGLYAPIGHADFYFNGGNQQPGCLMLSCSHSRAVTYAIHFIRNPNCYLGTRWQLGSRNVLSTNQCHKNNCAHAGFKAVHEKAHGVYYVRTSSKAPYCNA